MHSVINLFYILAVCTAVLGSPVQTCRALRSGDAKRAVGYFGGWDIYARKFKVTDIPATQLTHIIYSFANVNITTGEVYLSDPWADVQTPYPGDDTAKNGTNVYGNIKQLYLLKKKNRSLKTLLAIGGFTYSPNFVPTLASPSMRETFARSAVKLVSDLGFDGIDVDYEYPVNATEAKQLVQLLKQTRKELDSYAKKTRTAPYLLTAAVPAGPKHYKKLDFKGMDKYLDFWNFMGYDYAGSWDTVTGHGSNLYGDKANPSSTPYNTSTGIDYYIEVGGIEPSKINLGSPLYGRSFANTAGPGTPFNGTGADGSFEAGVWDYKSLPAPGYTSKVVELSQIGASYSYDASRKYLITFDTPKIAEIKADYIVSKNLGGSMWWEVSMDKTGKDSLISTTINKFGGVSKLEQSENHLSYPTSIYDNLRSGFATN